MSNYRRRRTPFWVKVTLVLLVLALIAAGLFHRPCEHTAAVANDTTNLQTELATTKSQLTAAQSELEATKSQLAAAQSELDATKSQLAAAQSELGKAQPQDVTGDSRIATLEGELQLLNIQLTTTKTQLSTAYELIDFYESQLEDVAGKREIVLRLTKAPTIGILIEWLEDGKCHNFCCVHCHAVPTEAPTAVPTCKPTKRPSEPTARPTVRPTVGPVVTPTPTIKPNDVIIDDNRTIPSDWDSTIITMDGAANPIN